MHRFGRCAEPTKSISVDAEAYDLWVLKHRLAPCLRRSGGGPGIINESCVLRDVVHHNRQTRIMATPGAIIIRQALLGDAPGFPNLMTELGYPATEQFVRERLAQLASGAEDVVFIADCAGEIGGFLSFHVIPLFHVEGNLGRITALVVSSRFRRCGIGQKLVTAAEEFAWAHGCVARGDYQRRSSRRCSRFLRGSRLPAGDTQISQIKVTECWRSISNPRELKKSRFVAS
jgi:GNAT superfamily N-acetyltransferase